MRHALAVAVIAYAVYRLGVPDLPVVVAATIFVALFAGLVVAGAALVVSLCHPDRGE